jgi:hypothetical protein
MNQFQNYHNSIGGAVMDGAEAYERGTQGDPLGAAVDYSNQDGDLASAKSNCGMWACIWSAAAFISFVMSDKKPKDTRK